MLANSFSWIYASFCCGRPPPQNRNDLSQKAGGCQEDEIEEEMVPLNGVGTLSSHENKVDTVVTQQPRHHSANSGPTFTPRPSERRVFLCCSASTSSILASDQVDLCPKFWFTDLKTCSKPQRFLWRFCFLVTCLPLCYPCYLSRSLRRRQKQRPKYWASNEQVNETSPQDRNNTILHRQVTMRDQHQDESAEPSVITINVILLRSPASRILHRYLKSEDAVDSDNKV